MRVEANITIAIREEVRYLPSTGANVNVTRHDLDPHFQGHEFWHVNISKTVRASAKCPVLLLYSFIFAMRQHKSNFYLLTDFGLNFQGHKFETFISRKRWELSQQKNLIWLLQRLILAKERHHCYFCAPWPWPSFLMSNILLCICVEKVRMQRMMHADLPQLHDPELDLLHIMRR